MHRLEGILGIVFTLIQVLYRRFVIEIFLLKIVSKIQVKLFYQYRTFSSLTLTAAFERLFIYADR